MQENEFASLKARLHRQGWTQGPDGSWTAPRRGAAVGVVEAGQSERAAAPALDRGGAERQGGEGGVVWRVALVAHRRRLLDDDNNVASMKPLRDAVAETLGLDDGDRRVSWECGQVRTDGAEGVAVRVEEIECKTVRKVNPNKVENSF